MLLDADQKLDGKTMSRKNKQWKASDNGMISKRGQIRENKRLKGIEKRKLNGELRRAEHEKKIKMENSWFQYHDYSPWSVKMATFYIQFTYKDLDQTNSAKNHNCGSVASLRRQVWQLKDFKGRKWKVIFLESNFFK